jgi:hypothetical protein
MTISLSYCGQPNTEMNNNEEPSNTLGIDTSVIAIFSYDTIKSRWYKRIFKDGKPTDLTIDELLKIDTILNNCINDYNPSQEIEYSKYKIDHPESTVDKKHFLIYLNRYKRQYLPIINTMGEKEVWVNCFCTSGEPEKWRIKIVSAKDGGNCFFKVKVNLSTGQFYDFNVNNEA